MERFVFEVIEPLIAKDLDEERRKARIDKVTDELKAFVKGQLVPINKQLAKKTRQLFVASSDIETMKENIESYEREILKLRGELSMKDSDLVKQRLSYERQAQQLKEEIESMKKEIKKTIHKCQNDLQKLNEEWTDKTTELKKLHKNQLTAVLDKEIKHWEETVETQRETFTVQKNHLLQQTSKQKSRLIKKYEEKIYQMKSESEDTLQKTTKDFTAKLDDLKNIKNDLFNKLTIEEANARRLSLELDREIGQHNMFRSQFETTFRELEGSKRRNQEERQKIMNQSQTAKNKMRELQRDLGQQIKQLQTQLKQTIEEKDKKFTDTVEIMNTDHRIEIQSLENNMIEEREIAITNVEVRAYEEMFQQLKKYDKLELDYRDLEYKYNNVKEIFEEKIRKLEEDHEIEIANMHERKEYEFELSGENAKRQYNNLMNKFTLEIRSLKAQQVIEVENMQKKSQEEKIAISNKLISQYEAMLSDQRNNTEIQIKQKLMEFQRKSKAYDKRIAESEKRKSQLKVSIERMKLESQMKIQSMMEVNEKLEEEIEGLHERILELQKAKSGLINDYQFQLLLLKNEIEKVKEEYRERQDELRANLNEKIIVKNKEMSKFAERIKQETEQLIRRHKERTVALEKEYEELKRVINQKTSLPEDIQALRVFHAAYIEKETQLISERRKRDELQRELHSKDAIEKVFATKEAFKRFTVIEKMGQTSKNTLGKFTSTQM